MRTVRKWLRKRQKEKKRLALLALVRKVREEQGDYLALSSTKRGSVAQAGRRRRLRK